MSRLDGHCDGGDGHPHPAKYAAKVDPAFLVCEPLARVMGRENFRLLPGARSAADMTLPGSGPRDLTAIGSR